MEYQKHILEAYSWVMVLGGSIGFVGGSLWGKDIGDNQGPREYLVTFWVQVVFVTVHGV